MKLHITSKPAILVAALASAAITSVKLLISECLLRPLQVMLFLVVTSTSHAADMNVLIVGSTGNSTSTGYVTGSSAAFDPTAIGTYLGNILTGAGVGTVNVAIENRGFPYDLAAWFHFPYPAGVETTTRWPNLRGESGTDWDYVVVIGDPGTMEAMPGVYAHGVAMVAQEVAKGGAETVLLMPWSKSGSVSVAHYKEVVYRAGRSGPYKVAPAALAWQAAGSPNSGTAHPTTDGAFIAAASIYSTIWNQSASGSAYVHNDTMADTVHTAVTTNNSASQYTGNFAFQNPFLMLGDKRRDVHFSEKGTSTEQDFKNSVNAAMARARVTYNSSSYSDKYSSDTPADDGMGWPVSADMPIAWNHGRKFSETEKEYVVNPAYWQLGMGFRYQYNTWSDTVADANDTHISQIMWLDVDLADYMKLSATTARSIPWRLIWAQIHQYNSGLNPLRDGTGPHLNNDLHKAVGTYMYTLYSGRCPLDVQPNPITTTWYANKVGYETAWRLGRDQTRAPGFKVLPSAATKKTIAGGTTETMKVQFILPPLSNVTVNIASSNPSVATVSPAQLTFTPANHSTARSITVTALDGLPADTDFDVVFNTVATDEAYNGLDDSWRYTALSNLPLVSWSAASQSSTSESGNMTVTAQLSAASSQTVTVPFTLSGSATQGADYTITASPITIPAGATTGSATITITSDTIHELGGETVILTMATLTNALLGATTVHTATIMDDDNIAPVVGAGPDQTVTLDEANPTPWTPVTISTVAWFDAADAGTITASSGAVSAWDDKSGNGNHLTQNTGASQPTTGTRQINGLNALDFVRTSDQYMNLTTTVNLLGRTALIVGLKDSADNMGLFGNSSINTQFLSTNAGYIYYAAGPNPYWANGAVSGSNGDYAGDGNANLFGYVFNSTNLKSAQNGTVRTGNAGAGSGQTEVNMVGQTSTAGAHEWDGAIAEIVILPNEDETSRQKVEGYLAHKWDLAANLPADHPYQTASPTVATATLAGSASDADNDPLTTTWSVISKPASATVAFANASAMSTTVIFTEHGTYVLRLTASDRTVTGYEEVTITVTDGASGLDAFNAWAGTDSGITFTGDSNDDGIADGMSWLLGAEDPTFAANGLLPQSAENSGNLTLTFKMLNPSKRGSALLRLEYSRDLGMTDLWTGNTITVPDVSGTVNGFVFTVAPIEGTDQNQVVATLPAAAANGTGKLFVRLSGALSP